MQWSKTILHRFAAPEITEFVTADIPDLVSEFPEWTQWMSAQFLNNVLRGNFKEPARQYVVNFIRRSQTVFRYYHSARELTQKYLDGNEPFHPRVAKYYEAIATWEIVVLSWAVCLDLVRSLNDEDVFKRNDGSPEQRAYSMHNTIKHHADDIRRGQLAGDDTLPLWMTSAGLKSKSDQLSFIELAKLVRDVSKLAAEMQDARTVSNANKRRRSDESAA